MPEIDDLLNQIFSRGRMNLSGSSPQKKAAPKEEKSQPAPSPDLPQRTFTARDLEQQAQEMDKLNQQIMADIQEMTRQLEIDENQEPLPTKKRPPEEAPPKRLTPAEAAAAFDGIDEIVCREVLGQERFITALTVAFKRPYIMGPEPDRAKNAMLLWGPPGTGKHSAVEELTRELFTRGVLENGQVAVMDLGLYPSQGENKLFLQDLYMLLNGESQVLLFDNFHLCHPAFLHMLATLTETGRLPLSSRYVLQKGILVDAGTALTADAVSALTLRGQYLVFVTDFKMSRVAESFGAPFLNALGDICQTEEFTTNALRQIAGLQLKALAKKCLDQLDFTLEYGDDTVEYLARRHNRREGVQGMLSYVARCYRAFSEVRLRQPKAKPLTLRLQVEEGKLLCDLGGGLSPIETLMPQAYVGELEAVKAELREIIGLENVKDYVLSLEENVQVQRMREAKGMRTEKPSMHMIFTGNPGTGKTTIARLTAKYLKAIGVLTGGQLVEVSRADLVGRYVGHTAPLTSQVLKSALGGVLFIDEAYSLYRGQDDSFGLEAIDTLVKGMEDNRDDLVVILAGYSKEMETFLTANSGLASRFPNIIEFPNYTGAELTEIAQNIAKGKGYRLSDDCLGPLTTYFDTMQDLNPRESGNGRMARNKVEEAILNQSRRILAEGVGELDLLLTVDFELTSPEDV